MPIDHGKPFMPHGGVHSFSGHNLHHKVILLVASKLFSKIRKELPVGCGLIFSSLSCDESDCGYEWGLAYRLTGYDVPEKVIPQDQIGAIFSNLLSQRLMENNIAIRSKEEMEDKRILKLYSLRIKQNPTIDNVKMALIS